ncbi:zinc-dependent alcohol dehydrogenase family protein [Streptomyces sp. NPDC004787]|uniref:zinc-dependent alcohol dehydrogenase family protein n=1 Tax=Streptomyces sp. NPDC004787 TaxID=3154291 RepID=UPI0033AD2297
MRAAILYGTKDLRVEEVPEPSLLMSSDALVRVVAACICGSDLWRYRGVMPTETAVRIGHEFVGIVEEAGRDVERVRPGDFVIASFGISDGTCRHCRNGVPTSCSNGAWWGEQDSRGLALDAGQGERVRVPFADGTLLSLGSSPSRDLIPDLLTLSDVFPTGYHAAVSAGVTAGSSAVVVGDGAVGLCAVLSSVRLGADRIVMMSRHPQRQRLAREFGATDIVAARGTEGIEQVRDLLGGAGADAVMECVGTSEALEQALGVVRPGGGIGHVGVPISGRALPMWPMFMQNISVRGGLAPAVRYMPLLLDSILDSSVRPGRVFDLALPLERAADGYCAMDERRSIKTLLWC